jgi:hypothetical protein
MTEITASMTTPDTNGTCEAIPLPKRGAPKSMLPASWLNRNLKVEYTDAYGGGQAPSGVLLNWCPVGPLLTFRSARTLNRLGQALVEELGG